MCTNNKIRYLRKINKIVKKRFWCNNKKNIYGTKKNPYESYQIKEVIHVRGRVFLNFSIYAIVVIKLYYK